MRVTSLYAAFPAVAGILTRVENTLIKPRDIDVYMHPDTIAEFRANMDRSRDHAWREHWNRKPPAFEYVGLLIHQDFDGGNEAPTVHWLGVPVLTIHHEPDAARPLAGDYVIRAINQFPDLGEAEWYGLHWLMKNGKRVQTRHTDFAIPTERPMFAWAADETDDKARVESTYVTADRLLQLGFVTRKAHNPTNEEKATQIWETTLLGKNAHRQFMVGEVLKRRAKS